MPKPKRNDETRTDYIQRAVMEIKHEEPNKPMKEVLGKAYGMFKFYKKKEK